MLQKLYLVFFNLALQFMSNQFKSKYCFPESFANMIPSLANVNRGTKSLSLMDEETKQVDLFSFLD